MVHRFQWLGNLGISRGIYNVPTLESFELDARYLYEEKMILVMALETWLKRASLPWKELSI
jgi:hypothetical protein